LDARTLIVLKAAFDGRWGKLPSTNCTMIEIARPQPNWINNSSGDKYQMSKEMLFSMDDEYGLQTGCRGKTLSDYGKCFAVWMGRNRPNPRLFCPDREVRKLCDHQCDSPKHLRGFSVFRDTSHHATKSHPGWREGFQFVERLLNDWLANLKQPASYCSALAV
jgi:hypothetical protein